MKAAIVIDEWKLDIFKKHLEKKDLIFEFFRGPSAGCLTIKISGEAVQGLLPTIEAANAECQQFSKAIKTSNSKLH